MAPQSHLENLLELACYSLQEGHSPKWCPSPASPLINPSELSHGTSVGPVTKWCALVWLTCELLGHYHKGCLSYFSELKKDTNCATFNTFINLWLAKIAFCHSLWRFVIFENFEVQIIYRLKNHLVGLGIKLYILCVNSHFISYKSMTFSPTLVTII